jgi:hypothetical protein
MNLNNKNMELSMRKNHEKQSPQGEKWHFHRNFATVARERLTTRFAAMVLGMASVGALITPNVVHATVVVPRSWPRLPTPSHIYRAILPNSYGGRIALETLSGLAAYRIRIDGHGPMLWIDTGATVYQRWLKMYRQYHGTVSISHPMTLWMLVNQLKQMGLVKGYVLYSNTGKHFAENKHNDSSVNIATSLCAPLGAIALDLRMVPMAKKMSLRELADSRGKTFDWLLNEIKGHFSHRILGLLSPAQTNLRDELVAANVLITQYHKGGGYHRALQFMHIGGIVLGWDGHEYHVTDAASRMGLRVVAADWASNIPLLSSGHTGLHVFGNLAIQPHKTSPIRFNHDKHYVAFISSDGDNVQWALDGFIAGRHTWSDPLRGKIPFGWSLPMEDLLQVCPYELNYLRTTAKATDGFVQFGSGYFYWDHFGMARGGPEALDSLLRRASLFLNRLGLHTMISFTVKWNSPRALAAYKRAALEIPRLQALFTIQFDPYAAGRGKIIWIHRKNGPPLPVLSAKAAIWNMPKNVYAGSPAHVARLLNRWAARPVRNADGRFTWVVVHAWSRFTEPGDNSTLGVYDAAAYCAAHLTPSIKVVTPGQLAELLEQTNEQYQ